MLRYVENTTLEVKTPGFFTDAALTYVTQTSCLSHYAIELASQDLGFLMHLPKNIY